MAEHDADRERHPIDEDAVWAAIVAGYGDEPPDPPGSKPFKSVDDLASLDSKNTWPDRGPRESSGQDGPGAIPPSAGDPPALGSSVVFAPGVGGPVGPRDHVPEPRDAAHAADDDTDDEDHFVPPEPPPLPESDVTAKFAWLGAAGGPLLGLLSVIFGWDMTWWLTTLCLGGFLGGVATLVARMQDDDEDHHDDPGHGAVV